MESVITRTPYDDSIDTTDDASLDGFFSELDATVAARWAEIQAGACWAHVMTHGFDASLYALLMGQIYYYTRHNSINQAVAAYATPPEKIGLLRFVYHHAEEELGHENMVIRDLRAAGFGPEAFEVPPFAPTTALVGYLYSVALRDGAVARLGYSYWAESAYDHIGPLLQRAREDLGLTDQMMSFFVAHSTIDAKHAEEVREAISRVVRTPEERQSVIRVADTTLYLTGCIINEAFAQFRANRHRVVR